MSTQEKKCYLAEERGTLGFKASKSLKFIIFPCESPLVNIS